MYVYIFVVFYITLIYLQNKLKRNEFFMVTIEKNKERLWMWNNHKLKNKILMIRNKFSLNLILIGEHIFSPIKSKKKRI